MNRLLSLAAGSLVAASFAPGPVDLSGTARLGDRAAAEAVVWLEPANGAPPPLTHTKAVLDQRNISFFPHVLAVQLGAQVEFPNHDRVFHNVFSDHDGKKFNLGLYPVGMVKQVPFDEPGLSRIFCNIHPQMSAYVVVVDTPYFSVADDSGHFSVRDVRPGSYRYHAWRPGGSMLNGSVIVTPGAVLEIRW
jgi:plastocyanin